MKKSLLIVLVVSMIVLSACGVIQIVPKPTATAVPTQTALPTYTPVPTYTPAPTYTPYPTPTTVPTVVSTATQVSPSKYVVEGIELKFTDVVISKAGLQLGDKMLTPVSGYSVLIVSGIYNGDINVLFGSAGVYQPLNAFVVTDSENINREWVYEYHSWQSIKTEGRFQVAFFVKSNSSPYILHSTVGTPFTIDLTKLMSDV
jgi:hypothetical protein